STFASGVAGPSGLAFNSAGDLFVGVSNIGLITEFTPGGVQSTFGLAVAPVGLVFNSGGNLLYAAWPIGKIIEFTPNGTQSIFASGLNNPVALAFQPVPEPSALGLLAAGMFGITLLR